MNNVEVSLQELRQIAKKLKEQNINFEYDIYGDGSDLGELYYLIDRYSLQENVFPKGKIDNELLKDRLLNYDFFVQLSISESLGMSVVEAQSLGIPCIVSSSGGLPEVVINKKTGFVSEYNDYVNLVFEMLKLKNDKEKYFQFSKEAIQFVNENYSSEIEIQKLLDLYSEF